MKFFNDSFDEIVQKIANIEKSRIAIGKKLREINEKFKIGPNEEIFDEKLINSVETFDKKTSVVGIDGGIVKSSLHGLDLILTRAVAVNFVYNDGKIENVFYYPSSNPQPNSQIIVDSLSEIEIGSCYNFVRQIMEIETAIESIKTIKPDLALLDGSVVPHYISKPDNPFLKEYYKKLIEKYKELFNTAENEKCILAGVIEDSRSNKFCDILIRRVSHVFQDDVFKEMAFILSKTRDTNLLYYLLEKGERTCIFNYSQNQEMHPLLKEFSKTSSNFLSFYLKTVEFDRPLRIDFVAKDKQIEIANEICNIIMKTSGHSGYGLPAILIEADQRAKLSQKDLDLFYLDLINKVGNLPSLFKLRRENRPF